ncbi:LOW QUALITY PROTEIN: hypothetical protein OSB04_011840 [Centaurea solstitialis]|uniref:Uncharacterized protein n=1 Tax=Centaurea solstitialis TaxID=347529 RepID=A0AA38WQB9_9ASTR|nr:LOW QUALITY PROTEIN: hypothetical protein OSB04_011840 [Centaurea solstitialis]
MISIWCDPLVSYNIGHGKLSYCLAHNPFSGMLDGEGSNGTFISLGGVVAGDRIDCSRDLSAARRLTPVKKVIAAAYFWTMWNHRNNKKDKELCESVQFLAFDWFRSRTKSGKFKCELNFGCEREYESQPYILGYGGRDHGGLLRFMGRVEIIKGGDPCLQRRSSGSAQVEEELISASITVKAGANDGRRRRRNGLAVGLESSSGSGKWCWNCIRADPDILKALGPQNSEAPCDGTASTPPGPPLNCISEDDGGAGVDEAPPIGKNT